MQLIILSAGQPVDGDCPSYRKPIHGDFLVMDWIQRVFQPYITSMHCVVGYKAYDLPQPSYPLTYHINPSWKDHGACGSLMTVPMDDDLIIHYGDILLHQEYVDDFMASCSSKTILVGVDAKEHKRETITTKDGLCSFIGCVFIPRAYIPRMQSLLHEHPSLRTAHIGSLLEALYKDGASFAYKDAHKKWCDFDHKTNIPTFFLGTKAQTLQRLRPLLHEATILPLVILSYKEWTEHPKACLAGIRSELTESPYIVRSSSVCEDGHDSSGAGQFDSFLNVPWTGLSKAIDATFQAYPHVEDDHHVLIQPMLGAQSQCSGVIFTRTMEGAPYYVLNYTDQKGDTTGVTSGDLNGHTQIIMRSYEQTNTLPSWQHKLIKAVQSIETIVHSDCLDIEFALCDNHVYILQVRPLIVKREVDPHRDNLSSCIVNQSTTFLDDHQRYYPHTCWSVMSDWNPAEMIGFSPKPLAFSLYRYFITDEIWAKQRFDFGYQDLRHQPLMAGLCGHPYIDVRKSIQSFLPRSLTTRTVERICSHALNVLKQNPSAHDKIEFDIIPTCFALSFDQWTKAFGDVLDGNELVAWEESLKNITLKGIHNLPSFFEMVDNLPTVIASIDESNLSPMDRLRSYGEAIKAFGTLPFAHLARCGFIASTFLRDIESLQIMSKERLQLFLSSLKTISTELQQDAWRVKQGDLSYDVFCQTYGHLRPGTYDSDSPTYNDLRAVYIDPLIDHACAVDTVDFQWTKDEEQRLGDALQRPYPTLTLDILENFIRQAIYGREYGKFIFTRYVSKVLSMIESLANTHGIPKHQHGYLTLDDLNQIATGSFGVVSLKEHLREREDLYRVTSRLLTPPFVTHSHDLWSFTYPTSHPNFITHKSITAPLFHLTETPDSDPTEVLKGKVIVIDKADPGYDWLFSYPIAGLITLYGGANSHMAIRCHEFGLPAAIGVGEVLYQTIIEGQRVFMDCGQRVLTVDPSCV